MLASSSVVMKLLVDLRRADPGLRNSCGKFICHVDAECCGRCGAALTIGISVKHVGGGTAIGTITMTDPAPPEGAFLPPSSDNAEARVPGGVGIPAGNTSATFGIMTSVPSTNASALISATFNGVSKGATLKFFPPPFWLR